MSNRLQATVESAQTFRQNASQLARPVAFASVHGHAQATVVTTQKPTPPFRTEGLPKTVPTPGMPHMPQHLLREAPPLQTPSKTQLRSPPPIPSHDFRVRREFIDLLNANLVNAIDLKARSSRAGWHARTVGNRTLSVSLGEFSDDLDAIADDLGYRISVLGGLPGGLVSDVAKSSRLPVYPAAALWEEEHVTAMRESITVAALHADLAIHIAIEVKDHASSDMLRRLHRRLVTQNRVLEAQALALAA